MDTFANGTDGATLKQVKATAGGRQSSHYQETSEIEPYAKISYGFRDAGRGTVMGYDGEPIGAVSREIICFDGPDEDRVLHRLMAHAWAADKPATGIVERVKVLAGTVIRSLKEGDDQKNWSRIWNICEGDPAGRKVRLGDLITHETGVCRHRSLLFKVLADHVGIPVGLVRGFFMFGGYRQGHAWNEVTDENGTMYIVDTMMGKMAPAKAPLGSQYLTHEKEKAYLPADHVFSFDPDDLRPVFIEKNGRHGIELNIRNLDSDGIRDLMTFMRQGDARGEVAHSTVQDNDPVLRFFGALNICAVERSMQHLAKAEIRLKDSISPR